MSKNETAEPRSSPPPRPARRFGHFVVLGLLSIAIFAQAWLSLRTKSLTFDEVTYIPSGYSYVVTGDLRLNPEHPPLTKLLAGAAILPLQPRLDLGDPSWIEPEQWSFGRRFFEGSGVETTRLVSAARLPTVLLTIVLMLSAYGLARTLYGRRSGLLAAWLCAFSPTLLAHGRLATNDLAQTALVTLSILAAVRLVRAPSPARIAAAGVAVGLALLTKYTAVLLLGLLAVWILVGTLRGTTPPLPERVVPRLASPLGRRVALGTASGLCVVALAALVVSAGYLTPGSLDGYLAGLRVLYTNVNLGIPTYFAGRFHPDGVPYYFLAAFALKTPTAFLALLGLRMVSDLRDRHLDVDALLYLLLPVAVWLVVIGSSALQFGVRYILPAYPLLFVYASGLLRGEEARDVVPTAGARAGPPARAPSALRRRGGLHGAVAVLALCFAGGSLAAHPHYLPYFNLLAGGPERGIEWLDDSNVDWGQDLPLLAEYLRENAIVDPVVAPMAWYDPALYGVHGRVVGPSEILSLLSDPAAPPGVYAASAHLLTRGRFDPNAPVDPLTDLEPVAILGHSIYVYER